MSEQELEVFFERAAPKGIGILEASVKVAGDGFHLEVVLDGLEHELGSVSMGECETFSRNLQELIDASVATVEGELPTETTERRGPLPLELDEENYTLEVSSAGAERRLRVPVDLERFKKHPMRLKFVREGKKYSELVTYSGAQALAGEDATGEQYCFNPYIPRRKRNRPGKKQQGDSFFHNAESEELAVTLEEVQNVNLYLDF